MQTGFVTLGGHIVGTIEANLTDQIEAFTPDVSGYQPMGRAEDGIGGLGRGGYGGEPGTHHHYGDGQKTHHGHADRGNASKTGPVPPTGRDYSDTPAGRPFSQGSAATDSAIQRAAKEAGIDVNTMRSIASIESSMNPSSNANRKTQYKGLYQIGHEEWRRFGEGNIYSAEDNAMAAARMFKENSRQFEQHFGRKPTDTELYMMHQQGLGFYTRGALTNVRGNPYPGMRGSQDHYSFEAGWGRELARRKAHFAKTDTKTSPEAQALSKGESAL